MECSSASQIHLIETSTSNSTPEDPVLLPSKSMSDKGPLVNQNMMESEAIHHSDGDYKSNLEILEIGGGVRKHKSKQSEGI